MGALYPVCLVIKGSIYFFIYLFFPDTDEELKEWQAKFEERIALLRSKISKLEREMNDMETMSSSLMQTINESIREIGKLQAEADVIINKSLHIVFYYYGIQNLALQYWYCRHTCL